MFAIEPSGEDAARVIKSLSAVNHFLPDIKQLLVANIGLNSACRKTGALDTKSQAHLRLRLYSVARHVAVSAPMLDNIPLLVLTVVADKFPGLPVEERARTGEV